MKVIGWVGVVCLVSAVTWAFKRNKALQLRGPLPRWSVLLIVIVGGVVLLVVSKRLAALLGIDFLEPAISEVGIALIAASMLAVTVDRWLKAEIVSDVFRAAIGHILRPELQSEINWIFNFNWMATSTFCLAELEQLPNGHVKITFSVNREVENIGSEPQTLHATMRLNDWGIPGHAPQIELCHAGKQHPTSATPATTNHAWGIEARSRGVRVKPREKVSVQLRGVEYKHASDLFTFEFLLPTKNPELQIRAPQTLEYQGSFTHHGDVVVEPFSQRQTLQGTFLPGQHLEVRWWPKAAGGLAPQAGWSGGNSPAGR